MRQGLLAAIAVMMSACGVGAPESADPGALDSELVLGTKYEPTVRDCRNLSVRPMATGTLRSATGMTSLQVAPVGSVVQSMYFHTTAVGQETRHGVVEFALPALGGRITHAELKFSDLHGWQLQPVPSDMHTLTLYTNADGLITADDWVREGAPFATFMTDLNTPVAQHSFDLTGTVALGGQLGVRVELDNTRSVGAYGSEFEGFSVEVTVCGESSLPHGRPLGLPH